MKKLTLILLIVATFQSCSDNNENAGNKTGADRDMLIDTTLSAPASTLQSSSDSLNNSNNANH